MSNFTYDIKINGKPINATLGLSVVLRAEEAFDSAGLNIPITTNISTIRQFDLVEIDIFYNNETKNYVFLVMEDSVGVVSKYGMYNHSVGVIEYTQKLNNLILQSFTMTKPIIPQRRAKFKNTNFIQTLLGQRRALLIQDLYVNSHYEVGDITIKKVNYPIGFYWNDDGTLRDSSDRTFTVYIKNNYDNIEYNLSIADRTMNIPVAGDYEFEIYYYTNSQSNVNSFTTKKNVFTFYVRVVDNSKYTLYDYLVRLRNIYPLETRNNHENTRLFDIDPNYIDYFKTIEMPQIFLSNTTLFQTSNVLLKYVNAITKLVYVKGGRDILSIEEMGAVIGEFTDENITDYESNQSIQDLATKGISFLSNAIQSNSTGYASTQIVGDNFFKNVRASEIQLTSTNSQLKLDFPIHLLTKFEVKIVGSEYQGGYKVFDFTHRIEEKSLWDLKNISGTINGYTPLSSVNENIGLRENKFGNLYWVKNSSVIDFSTVLTGIERYLLLYKVLEEGINEESTFEPLFQVISTTGSGASLTTATYPLNTSDELFYKKISFNVEYLTYQNPITTVDKIDIDKDNYYTEIMINQQEKQVDYTKTSRNALSQLERKGTPQNVFTKIHTNLNLLRNNLIDKNNNKIITSKYTFYNNHIIGEYETTKNQNRINDGTQINQEHRTWEVNNQNIYDRLDRFEDYMIITNPTENIEVDSNILLRNNRLTARDFKSLLGFYEFGNGIADKGSKITFAVVRTDEFIKKYNINTAFGDYLVCPVNAFAGADSLNFKFGFNHNLSAGQQLELSSGNYFNKYIYYTNDEGFFENLSFKLLKYNSDIVDLDAYPIQNLYNSTVYGDPVFETSLNNELMVFKDQSTNYNLQYIFKIIPYKKEEYVIGNYFYANNILINGLDPERITKGVKSYVVASESEYNNAVYNRVSFVWSGSGNVPTTPTQMENAYRADTFNVGTIIGNGTGGGNITFFRVIQNDQDSTYDSDVYIYFYDNDTKYNKFEDLKIKDGYRPNVLKVFASYFSITTNAFENTFTFTNQTIISLLETSTSWVLGTENKDLIMACNSNYNGFKAHYTHTRPNIKKIGSIQ